ncbi:MAG: Pantoate--beta-alanine ligase [Firmicutes bacterium]|nr:Pantoate--beta-alanine ligase [Bacillota bacterium]MDI6705069.1 pantoate--beta-alanine ligase [Bacillota bacterium]
MEVIKTKNELRKLLERERQKGKSLGFVPTMGFLHKGHLSLMERARRENDVVAASIFVNPTQFGPGEDYGTYPRDLPRDIRLARSAGVDYLFVPEADEMYPDNSITFVDMEGLTDVLCGASRPGHFRGVMTVVTKLFNIVKPDRAYFGQKDAQQVLIIKKMVKDLDMDIDIVEMPIVREEDGLAMSSRNSYLTASERKSALVISRSLSDARDSIKEGENRAGFIKEAIRREISTEQNASIDYIEIVDAETLKPIERIKGGVLIAVAVRIGKTRLIDNIKLEV